MVLTFASQLDVPKLVCQDQFASVVHQAHPVATLHSVLAKGGRQVVDPYKFAVEQASNHPVARFRFSVLVVSV